MPEQINLTPRPQLQSTQEAVSLGVAARPQNWAGPAATPNPNLRGIMEGLAAFNPALRQFQQNADIEQAINDEKALRNERDGGNAFAQGVTNPRVVLTGQPIEGPSPLPVAVSDTWRQSMNEQLAQRAGIEHKDNALSDFAKLKDDPDFNPDGFLQATRAAALQGITDPHAAAIVGQHMSEAEAQIRSVWRGEQLKRAQELADATLNQQASDMFTPDMNPDAVFQAYPHFLERAQAGGVTPKESATILFQHLVDNSNKLGGVPELFDVFDRKDGDGITLANQNPQLAQALNEARRQARATREKALGDAAEQGNAVTLMQLDKDLDERPETVTPERILSLMSPHGAIKSPEQAASFYERARESQLKVLATQQLQSTWDSHTLFRLEAGKQNQLMDANFKGTMDALVQASHDGDSAAVAALGARIFQVHSTVGATVPFDQLKGFISTLTTNLQPKGEPSPAFNSAVELFKAMSANPQYRDQYFNEDTSKVLRGYISAVSTGTGTTAAYMQAFQAISPEAKAAADAFVKTPAFDKMVKADAKDAVEGSSWWPKWLGGNGRTENVSIISAAIAGEMRDWRARNPGATDSDAAAYAQAWTTKNFVIDKTTGSAVRVPPALGGPAAQEAFSEHSKELTKILELGSRSDAKWRIQYVPLGSEGVYSAVAFDGMATQGLGPVNLQDMLTRQRAKKVLSDDERHQLGVMRQGVQAGSPPPMMSYELLAKAQALGVMKPDEVRTYTDIATNQFLERLRGMPMLGAGQAPSFDAVQYGSPATAGNVSAKVISDTASQFAKDGAYVGAYSGNSGAASNLAASLITMGEGVVLNAQDDPAKGAGKNIGMGYNLKANAQTAWHDLKAAGVPEERIDDVMAGRAQLEPRQAQRLLLSVLPRYEKQVHQLADDTHPGLWDRMQAQQKAVMIDMAYQVGSTDQFKKAWAALASGDAKTFGDETRVFYVNHSGEHVEDKRRGTLRANMLAGIAQWNALLQQYAKVPSNRAESAGLGVGQKAPQQGNQ